MKITLDQIDNFDFFENKTLEINVRYANYHNIYLIKETNYGIVFSNTSTDWVELFDDVLWYAELDQFINELPKEIGDQIIFNLELFR